MNTKQLFLALLTVGISFTSCTEDEGVNFQPLPLGDYQNGVLISNEGPFGTGAGTVSFISEDFSTTAHTVYQTVNDDNLGNIVQSIGFTDSKAYIIANNSHKATIVNRYSFEKETTIETGLNNPRAFVTNGIKGYISNWGDAADATDDFIAVIDLLTNTIESTIPVGEGPEKMLVVNNTLYVSHKGGWGQNNIISIINTSDNTVNTLTVGDVPDEMILDTENNIWVLCEGVPAWTGSETGGKLIKINTSDNSLEITHELSASVHPNSLSYEAGILYYAINGNVFVMDENAIELPTTPLLNTPVYTMAVKNNRLYTTDAADFSSNGTLTIFDINDTTEIQSITVGVIPGGIYFN